jgi:hypothetical protein
VDEDNFWSRLEYRVSAEMAGLADRQLRGLWCDGFLPDLYLLDDPSPRIEGRASVGYDGQGEWRFSLLLPATVACREGVPWSSLLPPPDVTQWLTVDRVGKRLVLEPAVAVTCTDVAARSGPPQR